MMHLREPLDDGSVHIGMVAWGISSQRRQDQNTNRQTVFQWHFNLRYWNSSRSTVMGCQENQVQVRPPMSLEVCPQRNERSCPPDQDRTNLSLKQNDSGESMLTPCGKAIHSSSVFRTQVRCMSRASLTTVQTIV